MKALSVARPRPATDAAAGAEQGLFVGQGGKLAALVGVEDMRCRRHAQGIGQRLEAEAHVE